MCFLSVSSLGLRAKALSNCIPAREGGGGTRGYIYTEDVFGEGDLIVINHRDSPPTFYGDRGQRSWIDITAASPALAAHIVDWKVDIANDVASDHKLIATRIMGKPQRTIVQHQPNWQAVDRVAFNLYLQRELLSRAGDILCQDPTKIN